jgi:2,3-bisphosphoglycerate-dependent phosphoglycerate mutase
MPAEHSLLLLRHGYSTWNEANLFTGWVDVRLAERGVEEGRRAGRLIREAGLIPDIVYTSVLTRAIQTADEALLAADLAWLPVVRHWRLNERHYGALQGKDKAATLAEYGPEQFKIWRRSYDVPPPPLPADAEFSQASDPRYADLGPDVPDTECLEDVVRRMVPYWDVVIAPQVRAGKRVLVVAHGNSLRALVKHLDGISDEDIAELNIPTGIPLHYRLDDHLKPIVPGGEYLDPEAAAAGAAAVAAQGSAKA